MMSIQQHLQRRPVLAFYAITFAISWSLFLLVGGSDFMSGAEWEENPAFMFAILAMLTGPAIAGVFMTWQSSGSSGLREMYARLTRWRVPAPWYVAALFGAPTIVFSVLLALSLTSRDFLPPVVSDGVDAAALGGAFGAGFSTLLEELGWTGFVTPRLRSRHSVLTTGLIVGVLWTVWHLLQVTWVARVSHAEVSFAVYYPLYLLAPSLVLYRVLMVWVYERTRSLLVVTLMHASYAGASLPFLLPALTGTDFLIFFWLLSGVLALVVVAVMRPNLTQFVCSPAGLERDLA